MENNSRKRELAAEEIAEIYEVISRGYQYDLGKPTMIAQIMNLGYDRETSIQLVDEFEKPFLQVIEEVQSERKEAKETARWQIIGGVLICIVGAAITLGSYLIAGSSYGGGTYIVTTGAFIVGCYLCLRGLIRWNSE